MTHTEHPAKTPSPRTGASATLRALLRGRGSGAPTHAPRQAVGRTSRLAAALALAAAAILLAAGPASAEIFHPFIPPPIDGTDTPGGSLHELERIAVDNSAGPNAGDLYVTVSEGAGKRAVDRLSPSGAYQCQITGAGFASTSASECDSSTSEAENPAVPGGSLGSAGAVAVDPASGDVYVADRPEGIVDRFSPAGKYLEQVAGLPPIRALAVDPTSGDLYIGTGEADKTVRRYDPVTKALTTFLTGVFGVDLAVDPTNGDLYIHEHVNNNQVERVSKFNSSAELVESWADHGRLTGTPAGPFAPEKLAGLAVDPSNGDLYLGEAPQTTNGGINRLTPGFVYQLDPSATFHGRISGAQAPSGFIQPGALAVAASGDVYLADQRSAGSVLLDRFGPGVVIPDVTIQPATEITPTAALLHGSVDTAGTAPADALASCRFEYVTRAEFQAHQFNGPGTKTAACAEPSAAEVPDDDAPHPVKAKVEGLTGGVVYYFRLAAANQNGFPNFSSALNFEALPPPLIDEAKAIEVGPHSATLTAQIDPRGAATTCQIEWGLTTEPGNPSVPYEHTEACQPEELGSGTADVPVSLPLTGLSEGATYHWRVHAASHCNPAEPAEECAATAAEHTFVYLLAQTEGPCPQNEALRAENNSLLLPDCRAYEQVSPTHKNGALLGDVFSLFGFAPQVAGDGSRLMASTVQCFGGAQSCTVVRGTVGVPYSFSRTAAGWRATPLPPPAPQADASTSFPFNAEAGSALFISADLLQEREEFYVRLADGSLLDIGPLTPPSGGINAPNLGKAYASMDSSTFAWEAGIVGQQPIWPFDPTNTTEGSRSTAYEYTGADRSQPLLVGVSGGPASTALISTCGTTLAGESGPMSSDGRTLYFIAKGKTQSICASPEPPVDELFARIDNGLPGAHTVSISEPQALTPPEPNDGCSTEACEENTEDTPQGIENWRDAEFYGASADGTKAYFASTQQLLNSASQDSDTGDTATGFNCISTSGPNGCNLYLYDFANPEGERLIDATAGDTSGAGPRFQGMLGISGDGSHAYFVAKGLLTEAPNARGQSAEAGADNLYVFERDAAHPGGHLAFIATLPGSDFLEWNDGSLHSPNVTPDGRFLVFRSRAQLTADDTSASAAAQVFRYDAQSGELIRLSIGERGFNDNGNRSTATPCAAHTPVCSEDAWIAPPQGLPKVEPPGGHRRNPTMSDDGARVFFTSAIALAPGALEDAPIATDAEGRPIYAQNVYEWEQQGTGGCARASGCVHLISGGRDASANTGTPTTCGQEANGLSSVCLLGADAEGKNVFFSTTDPLIPSDTDTELDYYDARVEGGFHKAAEPEICLTADACHTEGTEEGPQASPATPAFNGPGNAKYCPKGSVLKRGKCVKKHLRKHHKKHRRSHKRANTNRRTAK